MIHSKIRDRIRAQKVKEEQLKERLKQKVFSYQEYLPTKHKIGEEVTLPDGRRGKIIAVFRRHYPY